MAKRGKVGAERPEQDPLAMRSDPPLPAAPRGARDLTVVHPNDLIARFERTLPEGDLLRFGALDPVLRGRNAEGQIAAVWPRETLMAPIWHDDRQAVRAEHAAFDWSQQVDGAWRYRRVETKNNRGADGPKMRGASPRGLLRYLDLDVAMALTFEYMVRQRTVIALDEDTLLPWLGYSYLERPPYEDLRASVERIKHTDIVFSDIDPSLSLDERIKSSLNFSFRILQQASTSDGTRGGPLSATLSSDWKKMVEGSTPMMRQVFDLRGYFTLVRRIRHAVVEDDEETAPKISRSLYLFLAAWRRDDATRIPISWLQIRFAERQRVGGRNLFRYANPWHRNGRIWRSLERMLAFGILKRVEPDLHREDLDGDSCPYLTVVWSKPDQLDLIPPPKGVSQRYWLRIDKLGADDPVPKLEFAGDAPPPEAPRLAEAAWSEPPSAGGGAPEPPLSREHLVEWLRQAVELAPDAHRAALRSGWNHSQLALVYLWHYWRWSAPGDDPNRIREPGGYVRRIIESGARSGWTSDGLRERAGGQWDELVAWIGRQGREGARMAGILNRTAGGGEETAEVVPAATPPPSAPPPAGATEPEQRVRELRRAIREHLGKEKGVLIAKRALELEQTASAQSTYERLLTALREVAGEDAELVLELLGD